MRSAIARTASASLKRDFRRGFFAEAPTIFLTHDVWPADEMVGILWALEYALARGQAHVWEEVGTFGQSPIFRGPSYTAHARWGGFSAPCAYAVLPDKTAATYASVRIAILGNNGRDPSDADRLAAVDFDGASIGAAPADFPSTQLEGCYFHTGQSIPSAVHINSAYNAITLHARIPTYGRRCPSRGCCDRDRYHRCATR